MNEEIIRVENLTFEYPDTAVLKNVNFTLYKGEFLGIIGANGAGKSTLIKLILGLLPYETGRITLFGTELSKVRSRIGYVSQKANSFNTDFPATVLEVVRANLFSSKQKQRQDAVAPCQRRNAFFLQHTRFSVGIGQKAHHH